MNVRDSAGPLVFFFRDELAIGENLEIAIGMHCQKVEQFRMHEGLSAQDPEEGITVTFSVIDDLIEFIKLDGFTWLIHVHPAALAAQVAGVENGDVKEWREELPFFHALFKQQHRARALVAKVPADLR